jgi:hypothetical protein
VLCAGLLLAAVGHGEAEAATGFSVPGWRVAYPTTVLAPADPTRTDSPVQLSARSGLAGLDQFVWLTGRTVRVTVDAAPRESRSSLVLEFSTASGRTTGRRRLPLVVGRTSQSYRTPEGTDGARVLILREGGRSPLVVRRVALRDAGRQRLLNPRLEPEGCPPGSSTRVPPYGPVEVPGWRARYEASTLTAASPARSLDLTIRASSENGLSGIDQFVLAPPGPFEVRVRRPPRARPATLLVTVSQREPERPETVLGRQVREIRRTLRRGGGLQTFRFAPVGRRPGLVLGVAVVQPRLGSHADVDEIAVVAEGRQQLLNPAMLVEGCPPPPRPPAAAHVLSPWIRWPLTMLVCAAVVLAIARLRRAAPWWSPSTSASWSSPAAARRLALAAVALAPLVSVGTVKVGARIIWTDWLLLLAAVLLLGRRPRPPRPPAGQATSTAMAAALVLLGLSCASLALGLALYTDANLAKLPVADQIVAGIGAPRGRGLLDLLRLAQGVAGLFVLVSLLRSEADWLRVARIVVWTGIAEAAYGVYQVVGHAIFGSILMPPGSFPYPALERASGTFPEPIAYAGYLVFCAACAVALMMRAPGPLAFAGFAAAVAGVLLSRSSAGFASLLVLLGLVLVLGGRTPRRAVAVTVCLAALTLAVPGLRAGISDAVRKPFSVQNSTLDRSATWGAGIRMGATYAPIGVGRGQFAYDFAPFVDPQDVTRGGRAQSALIEVWAEAGPAGWIAWMTALLVVVLGPLRRGVRVHRGVSALPFLLGATLIAILATYYTSNYAWIWIALALATTAPLLVREWPDDASNRPDTA